MFAPVTPGEILLEEFLGPMGISQYRLAKASGVSARRINEITPETGIRMSRALGVSDAYWITMQVNYDLEVEKDKHQGEIDATHPLTA